MQSLYVMKNEFGLYKIGIASDPVARKTQIECTSGVPITDLWFRKPKEDVKQVERYLHIQHNKWRTVGEWFSEVHWDKIFSACSGEIQLTGFSNSRCIHELCSLIEDSLVWHFTDLKRTIGIEGIKIQTRDLSETLNSLGYSKIQYQGKTLWVAGKVNEKLVNEYLTTINL